MFLEILALINDLQLDARLIGLELRGGVSVEAVNIVQYL